MTQPPHAEGSGWTPPGGPAEPGPEAQPHPDPQAPPQPGPGAFPQAPYLPAQYQKPKVNGFSIAALVLGIIGGIGLSIIFGIVALVQIGRRGERGKAIAIIGMALSGVWLALIIGVAALGAAFTPDRDDAGHVTQKGRAFLTDLKVGDCFNGTPDNKGTNRTTVLPCDQPHDGEVLDIFILPKGGGFPGQKEVDRLSEQGCQERVGKRLAASKYAEQVDMFYLRPSRTTWILNDRSVQCLASTTGPKLTGPVDLSPADPSLKAWDALKVGTCVTFKDGEPAHTVRTVPCSKRHRAQMVLSFELPAGPWPGDSSVSRSGEKGCNTRLNTYFEKHPNPVDIRFLHVDPLEQGWNTGYREVRCFAEGDKGKDLNRSLMP